MDKTLIQQKEKAERHNNKAFHNQPKQNQISRSSMKDYDDWISDAGDGNLIED